MKYEESDFYCMNCGQRGLPCLRPASKKRESWHRKKLYCPHCKQIVNHIECKTDEDIAEFKIAFENGEFQEEAEISLKECAANDSII